ncbi:MAG: hypothetical protein V3T77_02195, partial [Planctomycetota bacterium]
TVPRLLDELQGKSLEPVLLVKYVNWLNQKNEANDRQEALRLVRGALSRHPKQVLLTLSADVCETLQANATFKLPEAATAESPPTTQPASGEGLSVDSIDLFQNPPVIPPGSGIPVNTTTKPAQPPPAQTQPSPDSDGGS